MVNSETMKILLNSLTKCIEKVEMQNKKILLHENIGLCIEIQSRHKVYNTLGIGFAILLFFRKNIVFYFSKSISVSQLYIIYYVLF